MMVRMNQTPPTDPGQDSTQTPAQTPAQTDAQTPAQTVAQTQTGDGQTPAQTQTPGQTQTQTPAQTGPQTPVTKTATAVAKARGFHAWFGRGGYLTVLTIIVGIIASLGQKQYAEEKQFTGQIELGGFDATPWFSPAVFDVAVAALMAGGLRAARRRLSPWGWWAAGAAVACLSIVTNFNHVGGEITGPASIVLFMAWALYLYDEFKTIRRDREIEDATASDFRSTDIVFEDDPDLARIAHRFARLKPLDRSLAYRHSLGDVELTKRDVALMAATLYRDLLRDRLEVELKQVPEKKWGNAGERRAAEAEARRRAELTARFNVDAWLGLPVPELTGMEVPQFGYITPPPPPPAPIAPPVQAQALTPGTATAAAPAALPTAEHQPELTASPRPPAPRRREVVEPEIVEPVVLAPGQPSGPAGKLWRPLDQIPGMPLVDESIVCECHPSDPARYCGHSLAEHTRRIGQHLEKLAASIPAWPTRPERIGTGEIKAILGITGKDTLMKISWVLDQLRVLAIAQQEQAAAPVVVVDAQPQIEAAPAAETEQNQGE